MTTKETLLELAEFMRERGVSFYMELNDEGYGLFQIINKDKEIDVVSDYAFSKDITPEHIEQAAKEMEDDS